MSLNNILDKLQDLLNNKLTDLNPVKLDEFGPGFTNQYPQTTSSFSTFDADDEVDVPDVSSVDVPYTTSRAIPVPKGKKGGSNYLPFESAAIRAIKEAEVEKEKEVEVDNTPTEPDLPEDDTVDQRNMDQDMGGMNQDMNLGMGIGGEEEEKKSAGELGRIYELKKIYARLTAIEIYLASESSKELLQVRGYVSQSIELFEVISANFDSYTEKLDEIIIMFYKFLLEVYANVKDYYKKEAASSGDK